MLAKRPENGKSRGSTAAAFTGTDVHPLPRSGMDPSQVKVKIHFEQFLQLQVS